MSGEPTIDRRRYAVRDDLAAIGLKDRVDAPRYVAGQLRQVTGCALAVRQRPEQTAPLDTEALLGETVTVYDEAEGWAWVQLDRDGYVGYVASAGLASEVVQPTHRVGALLTVVYQQASALSEPVMHAPHNGRVTVAGIEGEFARLAGGGCIGARHLLELGEAQPDYVANALRFAGLPYVYGGKTALGLDCSGLVQNVLQAAGIEVPRDSDMQLAEIETRLENAEDLSQLQRGDIVFWPGHAGIMIDRETIVHANATNMSVTVEAVADVAARSRKEGPLMAGVSRPQVARAMPKHGAEPDTL